MWRIKEDPDYVLDSIPKILNELDLFYQAGGRTMVDATAIDYGRDARDLIKVAEQTPVQIVALTGFNRGDYADDVVQAMTTEAMSERCIADIEEGMDGTATRAGLVKTGTSASGLELMGVAKVLSTTTVAPARWPAAASRSRSSTLSVGVVGLSKYSAAWLRGERPVIASVSPFVALASQTVA